jgi:hypothetical protein
MVDLGAAALQDVNSIARIHLPKEDISALVFTQLHVRENFI